MRRQTSHIAIVVLAGSLALGSYAQTPPKKNETSTKLAQAEAALSNADVIKLSKLDLGDEIVIAKINQAKNLNLNLSTDGLIQLKQNGVSKEVIAHMLRMTTQESPALTASTNKGSVTPIAASGSTVDASSSRVMLSSKAGNVELSGRRGETKLVNAFITAFRYQVYPVISAKVRILDTRPKITVALKEDPKRSQAFLVRLEGDTKTDSRSLKVGQGMMGAFSGSANGQDGPSPDSDWVVATDDTEERPGVWVMTPKNDLPPGEYGYYYRGTLYDFGVDK